MNVYSSQLTYFIIILLIILVKQNTYYICFFYFYYLCRYDVKTFFIVMLLHITKTNLKLSLKSRNSSISNLWKLKSDFDFKLL